MTSWKVIEGDCLERLRELDAGSIDCVVTDPPYGIGFMGHEWDQPGEFGPVEDPEPQGGKIRWTQPSPASGNGHARDRRARRDGVRMGGPLGVDQTTTVLRDGAMHAGRYDLSATANRRFQAWCEAWAAELLRVLKPGGYLLAFGGCRTYHRLAAGIEDAGFEIRDQIDWLFGSGFPKSRQLADGVGTALKPGHEPIVLARAPLTGTTQATFDEHGTAGLNIDACSIPVSDEDYERNHSGDRGHDGTRSIDKRGATDMRMGGGHAAGAGRWPSNVVLDEDAAAELDEQTGELRSGANPTRRSSDKFRQVYGDFAGQEECDARRGADSGGASRFYYCAKTSTAERNAGLDGFPAEPLNWSNGDESPGTFQSAGPAVHRNHHPTVKPIDLMQWLIRLVAPPGGTVLDPFTGSGTTGIAALREQREFVGIERDPSYVQLARARIVGDAPLLNAAGEAAA